MRDLLLLSPLLLAACAAATPNDPVPVRGATGDQICDASNTARFIGMVASGDTKAAIRAATGSASLRTISPGQMVTMEFSANRVTVHLDAAGKIIRIVCG